MDSRDEPLAGRNPGETSHALGRISAEGEPSKVQDPVEAEEWSSPRVTDLVGWMVRRPQTRRALETAMAKGAFDGREHSQQFLALVDIAVDLSRLETEGSTPDPESLDLRETVEAAYRSLPGAVPGSLVLNVDEDVPLSVHADRDQLERVLAALISISTPVNGGTATRIAIHLGLGAGPRMDGATVLVIEVEGSESQDERPEPVPPAGRRLGLAVCSEIVTLMGGELAAEPSSAGQGGFRLALPAGARQAGVPG